MATFSPTSALVRLDLPTLGRPQTVIMAVFVMFDIGDPQLSLSVFVYVPLHAVRFSNIPQICRNCNRMSDLSSADFLTGAAGHPQRRQFHTQNEFYQPHEKQQHQNRDQAGGHQHNCQSLQKAVQHIPKLLHRTGRGAGNAVRHLGKESGKAALFRLRIFALAVLNRIRGILGLLNGSRNGCLIGILDQVTDPDPRRDHQHDRYTEQCQFPRQCARRPPQTGEQRRGGKGRAGRRDQDLKCRSGGDGQQIFFQKNGAEHDEKIAAEIRQLVRDRRSRVTGQQRDRRRCRCGGRSQFQNRLLLFLQCGDRLLVKGRVRGEFGHAEYGSQRQNHCRRHTDYSYSDCSGHSTFPFARYNLIIPRSALLSSTGFQAKNRGNFHKSLPDFLNLFLKPMKNFRQFPSGNGFFRLRKLGLRQDPRFSRPVQVCVLLLVGLFPKQDHRRHLSGTGHLTRGKKSLGGTAAVQHQRIRHAQAQQLVLKLLPGQAGLVAPQADPSIRHPAHSCPGCGAGHIRRQASLQLRPIFQKRHPGKKTAAPIRQHLGLPIRTDGNSPVLIGVPTDDLAVDHRPANRLKAAVKQIAVDDVAASGLPLHLRQRFPFDVVIDLRSGAGKYISHGAGRRS
nr:MAG TPA: hypothetical protein [Caudoviricetes sp.]